MNKSKDNPFINNLKSSDKTILKFFSILLVLFFSLLMANQILFWKADIGLFINEFLGTLVIVFLLTGILVLRYHYKRGIIKTKTIMILFTKIAFVIALIVTTVIFLLIKYTDYMDFSLSNNNTFLVANESGNLIIMFTGLFIALFLMVILIQCIYMLTGFGIIGILSAIERVFIPQVICHIIKITPNISDSIKEKDMKIYAKYSILGWIFNIPDTLETKSLTLNQSKPRKRFPWSVFKTAIIWEIFFGTILIAYICLNPFLLEKISIGELVAISSNISYFIPILILPWFIFHKLDARIKGPVRDFKLYNGIKYRTFQTLVAFGALLIFIRLALKNIDLQSILLSFISYYVIFLTLIIIFTFIYFNYFENDLARDIAKRSTKMKD